MIMQRDFSELLCFLAEYDAFLTKMLADEEEKLQALVSSSLPRIEHAISAAQANAKQMENLELQRQAQQTKAGVAGMAFSEILPLMPQTLQPQAKTLFHSFSHKLQEIKFRNAKSMDFARTSIRTVNPDALREEPALSGRTAGNAYTRSLGQDGPSLLETKI